MEESASSADRSLLPGAFYRNRENGKKLNRKKIIVRDLKKKRHKKLPSLGIHAHAEYESSDIAGK